MWWPTRFHMAVQGSSLPVRPPWFSSTSDRQERQNVEVCVKVRPGIPFLLLAPNSWLYLTIGNRLQRILRKKRDQVSVTYQQSSHHTKMRRSISLSKAMCHTKPCIHPFCTPPLQSRYGCRNDDQKDCYLPPNPEVPENLLAAWLLPLLYLHHHPAIRFSISFLKMCENPSSYHDNCHGPLSSVPGSWQQVLYLPFNRTGSHSPTRASTSAHLPLLRGRPSIVNPKCNCHEPASNPVCLIRDSGWSPNPLMCQYTEPDPASHVLSFFSKWYLVPSQPAIPSSLWFPAHWVTKLFLSSRFLWTCSLSGMLHL